MILCFSDWPIFKVTRGHQNSEFAIAKMRWQKRKFTVAGVGNGLVFTKRGVSSERWALQLHLVGRAFAKFGRIIQNVILSIRNNVSSLFLIFKSKSKEFSRNLNSFYHFLGIFDFEYFVISSFFHDKTCPKSIPHISNMVWIYPKV